MTGNPDLAGIFGSNDNMALGAVESARAANLLDQLTIVGFDANPNAAAAILAGDMEGDDRAVPEEHRWLRRREPHQAHQRRDP
ncbi:MAG: substrate-binding domain-containing protein [Chloroflexota bacterium]